jgi:hypothetical protein
MERHINCAHKLDGKHTGKTHMANHMRMCRTEIVITDEAGSARQRGLPLTRPHQQQPCLTGFLLAVPQCNRTYVFQSPSQIYQDHMGEEQLQQCQQDWSELEPVTHTIIHPLIPSCLLTSLPTHPHMISVAWGSQCTPSHENKFCHKAFLHMQDTQCYTTALR